MTTQPTMSAISLEYEHIARACDFAIEFLDGLPTSPNEASQQGRLSGMLSRAAKSARELGEKAAAPPPPPPPPRCIEQFRDGENATRCYLPENHEGWHRCGGETTWAPRLSPAKLLDVTRRREVRLMADNQRLRESLEVASSALRKACNDLHALASPLELAAKHDWRDALDAADAAEDASRDASRAAVP